VSKNSSRSGVLALSLGATGVVFGDIGTSPLYAFRESFANGGETAQDVFGLVSLIFWALMIVVTVKYLLVVMRADNHGEGGILSLLALMPRRIREHSTGRERALFLLVLVGTALLFGDGVLTPAISVLSATEGLNLVNPAIGDHAVEIAVVILILLFAAQSRGTHRIGLLFGPVMVIWFLTIAGLGVYRLLDRPDALLALSPTYAIAYVADRGWQSLAVASSVILAVTGAEALYADMGHFGRHPIRLSWAMLVGPALVLCYLGQAALVLKDPSAATNPFFGLAPAGGTLALVLLATAATVVASQALITGVFSLARQGIQLGVLPRLAVKHTHADHEGQIYVPFVNFAVGVMCIAVVLTFRSSSALAHAYVLAIAGTMFITTIAFHAVASRTWDWPAYRLWPLTAGFLLVDTAFLAGTLSNVVNGGWVPIVFGAVVMVVMVGWSNGYRALNGYMARTAVHWPSIQEELRHGSITRVPGVGVFLASPSEEVPSALSSQIKVLHAMPAEVIVVTVRIVGMPVADTPPEVEQILPRISRITIPVGYMETPDVPGALRASVLGGLERSATYYLSERKFVGSDAGDVGEHREKLFAFLHRNSQAPSAFFGLPPDRVISIGTRIDL